MNSRAWVIRRVGAVCMLAGMSAALIALILIVLFMAFGFGLLGFALSVFWTLIWYSIVGLVIGGLGRLLVSGRQQLGLVETALFGIAGALLGGIVANDILDLGWFGQFLTAVIIAALLVLVTGAGQSRGRTA